MNPTVAVTGAAGFLGSLLLERLTREGTEVRAVDLQTSLDRIGAVAGVEKIAADITDPASLAGIFDGCETVYHLAALVGAGIDPTLMNSVNVDGAINVAHEAHRGGAVMVHLASTSALGQTPHGKSDFDEGYLATPRVGYERTKQAGLLALRDLHSEYGYRIRFAIPGMILGHPDSTGFGVTAAVRTFATKWVPAVGPSDAIHSFAGVDDVVEGVVLIAAKGDDGRSYVLSESCMAFGDLFSLVAETAGRRRPVQIPRSVFRPFGPVVRLVARATKNPSKMTESWTLACESSQAFSGARAKDELGWDPTPAAALIEEFVAELTASPQPKDQR